MLHELFIILSGHPSPLFSPTLSPNFPLVSASERALLNSLSALGNLHISLRRQCTDIVSAHPSTIARAIASAIDAVHLQSFRDRVVAVEASVLSRESGVVGGYDIVALAKILSDFDGWDRILQYLDSLTGVMLGDDEGDKGMESVKGAHLINRLRKDIHTGYPRLEEVAVHLLQVAETTWLRQVSTWVLYGRLPSFGGEDFFIREKEGEGQRLGDSDAVLKEYMVDRKLLPAFVEHDAASSVLFIGRSLNHVRIRGGASLYAPNVGGGSSLGGSGNAEMGLLTMHLSYLQALKSPLTPQKFTVAIAAIRLSLSQHTLQTLLPAKKIVEILHVLREFYLLGRGEFAVALINQADERLKARAASNKNQPPRPLIPLDGKKSSGLPVVKEGEVAAILTRTWGILAAYESEEDADERLELAREAIYLSLVSSNKRSFSSAQETPAAIPATPATTFNDLFLSAPITLNFTITWPLELFLAPSDIARYDRIFHLLLSSRQCLSRLQSLWRDRRVYTSANPNAQSERFLWATASLATFFVETIVAFWQRDVIGPAFEKLLKLFGPPSQTSRRRRKRKRARNADDEFEEEEDDEADEDNDGDVSMADAASTLPATTTVLGERAPVPVTQQDPATLSLAHRLFLTYLTRTLLLTDPMFPTLFRSLLELCSGLAENVVRLNSLHAVAFVTTEVSARLEAQIELLNEQSRKARQLMGKIVERLQKVDEERGKRGGGGGLILGGEEGTWEGSGGVDGLLMRLNWEGVGGGEGM